MATKQVPRNGNDTLKLLSESTATDDSGVSNLYYMELLDEYPDSSDTMRYVSDILLQHASSKHQDSYVVFDW